MSKLSITQTLSSKELSSAEKLASVQESVAALRKSYGNADKTIADVKVNTAHGMLPFSHLEEDGKIEVLLNEAQSIKATAIAEIENNAGLMLNKVVEQLIATSPVFANASAESEFDVL